MVNVYIRRKKKIFLFYSRRRRGLGTQEPSAPSSCKDIPSLEEGVQHIGLFSIVNDFIDTGFIAGLPKPCISMTIQEKAEVQFENNAVDAIIKPENGIGLNAFGSLPEGVSNKDSMDIGTGMVNSDHLLTVVQQLTSTWNLPRRPRSARKHTSLSSRNWNTHEYSASDTSKQRVFHFGASTSVCCEVIPKTPNNKDEVSKLTSKNFLSGVQGLLSTGMLEGAPVTYKNDSVELTGILTTSGVCCGCSLCNFKQVVSSSKFEKHAGSSSSNRNDHIFLENGVSLYALSKELKNVPLGSLGKVIAEKFGHPTNIEVIDKAWKGNTTLHYYNGESTNQNHLPNLLDVLQSSLNFPKGRRSERTYKPPLIVTSKVNRKVSRQLAFCDVDLQHPPAHKKRGVDIVSSKMLMSLKGSSEFSSSGSYQSNIGEVISQNLSDLNVGKNQANISVVYTPHLPLSSVNCLLATGLLEGLMVKYRKDETDLRGFIKDVGICCGCSSCCFRKVLSSLKFGKHGGDSSRDPNDYIFVNGKITLSSLVRELGKIPLGLLSCEVIKKLIGTQPNNLSFLAWKESFHDKNSNLQRTSCDDVKDQLVDSFLPTKPSPAERLRHLATAYNLPFPSGDYEKNNLPGQVQNVMKHREQDFHQQIFELLNDGSWLSYRSHGKEVLIGYKFGKNILCSCCNVMLSASKFEAHAGYEKRRKPYHSIYTSYNKSLNQIAMFLLLDNFSFDPKYLMMTYKAGSVTGEQSHSCASSPFRVRSGRIMAPCNLCSCMLCRDGGATLNFGNICENTLLFCGQCSGMFHVGCLRHHGICDIVARPCPPDIWLCGNKCGKVRADLLDFIQGGSRTIPKSCLSLLRCPSVHGTLNMETNFDVHWQLLSGRFQCDKSASILQQATTTFRETFGAVYKGHRDVLSTMVNGGKGVAEFFGGMFCAVLTVKSVIVSAALLRVFDNHIAELPLAVTSKERQREGYFKILLLKIEEMLSSMKVENLVLAADDHSLPIWVEKFGFSKLSLDKILEYQMNHRILMFENTTMLQKVPSAF